MADNNNDNDNESTETEIDFDELSDDMKARLMENPQVRRYVEYEDSTISNIVPMLRNLRDNDNETFSLFVEGIAERSGRVTQSTVEKVLNGAIEEYESVSS